VLRALAFAAFGLLIGSFLTVVVWRVPRRESVVRGRSKCPSCGAMIGARDNVPVFSWLVLRGRCRRCGARISPIYPATELATAVLFAGASLAYDDVWVAALMAAFLAVLLAVSFIDVAHKVIPNRIVYPSIVVALVAIVLLDVTGRGLDWVDGVIGFAAFGGGLLVIALISPRGMGMGDVKLAALIGLVTGSVALSHVAVAAGAAILLGGLGAIVLLAMGRGRKAKVPFGPYLAAGAAVATFWGAEIANWYTHLMT
jgi:leader peptidase (prepilin peptidase)/N-methyltransferase